MLTRLLSLLLRHDPAKFQIVLDEEGWTSLPLLIQSIRNNCHLVQEIDESTVRDLVATQKVDRFEISGDRIRCKYGHSLSTVQAPNIATPPPVLYHATAASLFSRIQHEGLKPQRRSFVHLTSDWKYALNIRNMRHPGIIFAVDTAKALTVGRSFREASDEVWLSPALPPAVLSLVTVHPRTREPQRSLPLKGTGLSDAHLDPFLSNEE